MKTAISIPNPIFEAAEQLAKELGMSRSELYTTAIAAFVEAHQGENLTEKLNQLYAEEVSTLDPVLARMQTASLDGEPW
ncbi:MAG: ribbon-helix-helix domain-containing protein [Anaerolineae bacterium]|nr:ribbon-helix-helix domain-containing protein [Anaerolineae bacterium]